VLRFLLLPVTFALLLTSILGPLVDLLENRGLSRKGAVSVVFGGLLGALGASALAVWPSLESWLRERPTTGERSVFEVQLEHRLDGWQASLASTYHQVDWVAVFGKLREVLQHQRQSLVEGLPAMALEVVSHSGAVVLALIITAFVLLDGWAMKKPNRHFENVLVMLDRVDRQIASYLVGTASESAIVTLMLAVPLWLLGMPNAFLFALIFGVANVIPFAGPFIGAAAGMLFSLLDPNAPSMGALAVVYLVVHFIDAGVINPLVMGKSLDMHPLTVIVGIAIGGSLGGVLGMLVIIPLLAVTKAIVSTVADGVRNALTA
jgi:predicted PurR-regulated permease PerM